MGMGVGGLLSVKGFHAVLITSRNCDDFKSSRISARNPQKHASGFPTEAGN